MLRRKRPSCRYSVRRTPREARDARGEEAVRDRLRQEQTADQAQIATEGKDLYPLRSEGATITVRQKTGMAIVRQEISVTGTARVAMAETKEMEEIATARIKSARDVISATVTEETKIVRTGVKEMVRTKTARAETSVIATVRAEIIETEGTAMAETETVRDASVTARAEEEETEEITDHPFRPRLWQNRSRKGDPRRIIIRKKSMIVTRSEKANLVRSKARERKISSL